MAQKIHFRTKSSKIQQGSMRFLHILFVLEENLIFKFKIKKQRHEKSLNKQDLNFLNDHKETLFGDFHLLLKKY